MISIPKQLQRPEFRFIRTNYERKAIGKKWQLDNNYSYTDMEKYKNDPSYGVLCGRGRLLVVDFDTEEGFAKIQEGHILYDTFTVKGSKGGHKYILLHEQCPVPNKFKLKVKIDGFLKDVGDVQGVGSCAIGPSSIHNKTGKPYEILMDVPIKELSLEESNDLIASLQHNIKNIKGKVFTKINMDGTITEKEVELKDRSLLTQEILSNMSIFDILQNEKVDNLDKNPCMCPLHDDSENRQCFSYDDELKIWNCFHCEASGNPIELYRLLKEKILKEKPDNRRKSQEVSYSEARNDLVEKYKINPDEFISKNKEAIFNDENQLRDTYAWLLGKNIKLANYTLAEYLIHKHHFKTFKDKKMRIILIYNKDTGAYEQNGVEFIQEEVIRLLRSMSCINIVSEVTFLVEGMSLISEQEFLSEPDKNKILLQDCILDIKTMETEPFNPKYMFHQKFNVKYDPAATCESYDKFLSEVMDEDSTKIIWDFHGELLERDYKSQVAVMCNGPGGNGKDVLTGVISEFAGYKNSCSVSLQTLANNNFAGADLHRRLLNLDGDMSDKTIEDSGNFKKLTGGSRLRVENKHEKAFDILNYAKFFVCCNTLPQTNDKTDAFFRRWRFINFPVKFWEKGKMELEGAKIDKFNQIADKSLKEKLISPELLSGILNKSIVALKRLRENKYEYRLNSFSENVREIWIQKSEPFMAFLNAMCEEGTLEDSEYKSNIRKAQLDYFKKNKIKKKITDKNIKYYLETEFGCTEGREGLDGSRKWIGIKLKNKQKTIPSQDSQGSQGFEY